MGTLLIQHLLWANIIYVNVKLVSLERLHIASSVDIPCLDVILGPQRSRANKHQFIDADKEILFA